MLDKLQTLATRFDELEARLAAPDLYDDPKQAAGLLRERNRLEPIVTAYRALEAAQATQQEAQEMLSDPDLRELAQEVFTAARA